jgi:hypothetical protein
VTIAGIISLQLSADLAMIASLTMWVRLDALSSKSLTNTAAA